MSRRFASRSLLGLVLVGLASCSALAPVDTEPQTYEPVWISASWGGGAVEPNDRTDRSPASFLGQRCPATSVRLENYASFSDADFCPYTGSGLFVWNNCSIINSVGICVRKGSLAQPGGSIGNLQACATDPLATPFLDLKIITLNPGKPVGFCIPTTGEPSVEVFYCTDQTWLMGPPGSEKVTCMALPNP